MLVEILVTARSIAVLSWPILHYTKSWRYSKAHAATTDRSDC